MSTPFLILALISVGVGIISSIAVTNYVSKHGVKVNYFLWRIMIFKYFIDNQRLTKQETGKAGPWSYVFIASMILAAIFAVIGIALK
jgi:hypothetical protein